MNKVKVSMLLHPSLKAEVDAYAKKNNLTFTAAMERMCEIGLNAIEVFGDAPEANLQQIRNEGVNQEPGSHEAGLAELSRRVRQLEGLVNVVLGAKLKDRVGQLEGLMKVVLRNVKDKDGNTLLGGRVHIEWGGQS